MLFSMKIYRTRVSNELIGDKEKSGISAMVNLYLPKSEVDSKALRI
jgi:hypothetical protein